MMSEIVARNVYSKAIADNKNAIVASCWTYFTTIFILVLPGKEFKYFLSFSYISMNNITPCRGHYVARELLVERASCSDYRDLCLG